MTTKNKKFISENETLVETNLSELKLMARIYLLFCIVQNNVNFLS